MTTAHIATGDAVFARTPACACGPGQNNPSPIIIFKKKYIIIILVEMTVFNMAGYLIEEMRRWPVITAFQTINKFERKAHSDKKTVPVAWLD